ncbi:hypothetical protein [Methylocystis sp.]|uniref:hypothetical protein n=1 Tax=Methylocystis sp. TaxID=1911079 RepID=UPI0025F93238|nr:hypothetical protein [Methylocystis sp.]
MLASVEITFTWQRERNPRDYEVIEAPRSGKSGMALLDESPRSVQADRIAPKLKCLDRYQPLDEFPALWEQFAAIKKREDAIKFVRNYGPLSRKGLQGKGDIIEDILDDAQLMRDGCNRIALSKLVAIINSGRLTISPDNLLDAIWLQYADARSKGRANRCPQCDKIFAKGPDAGRRADAKFCSPDCKDKFKSLARSRP